MAKKIKIAVLFGGKSSEHFVSIMSAKSILEHLDETKYDIIPLYIDRDGNWLTPEASIKLIPEITKQAQAKLSAPSSKNLDTTRFTTTSEDYSLQHTTSNDIDVIFPVVHGEYGEDGRLQGTLESLGLPYIGSGVLSSALAMNKIMAKKIIITDSIPTPEFLSINKNDSKITEKINTFLSFPLIIKPAASGSGIGISLVEKLSDLDAALDDAFIVSDQIIAEQYIKGRELTIGIIGNNKLITLPTTEIIPNPEISKFYDITAKYAADGSRHVCPAEISVAIDHQIKKYARKAYQSLNCRGIARIDFMLQEKTNKLFFLEANTLPGMTATSLFPESAAKNNINFPDLLDKLINLALEK